MSDTTTPPATPEVEAHTPVQTPPAPAAETQADPNWLPARLERERRTMLKQLGVENVDDAKAALAELKKRQDAEKGETERLRAQVADLEVKANRAVALEGVIALKAKAELDGLTAEQREAVMAIAGDDAGLQLKSVEMLRPTWKASEAPKPAPLPAPASTTAAAGSPPPTNTTTTDVVASYERLKKENPIRAAYYYLEHVEELSKPKRNS